ncbi:Crossover junction endonuclease MUS81 [Monocercomonoides exilis]|uniref:Crossover junction endonuclease MUS81 n=1 Tax=Monocercomonoides exilis TaxID=2049356 RepID=UPI003559BFA1|nr:Crossover junction endonuclease MUS81 [Monocercomonoides exilis]|eukprot:MONOS_6559.1-p1 / transcript=MONOS_6559.1 / gene=MONOS_6559 / organism=Monocercomonoides_exilis_PA203 / gene_product=Crossover junction endonuclease MUS81 / transcript_product=Crossover junction endonuclease MUS81 / location=Mono_scaffold00208:50451-52517(-) / protein_length=670 / sequence_SO=supercontig / SO=protein_coding / is_pseudo=false
MTERRIHVCLFVSDGKPTKCIDEADVNFSETTGEVLYKIGWFSSHEKDSITDLQLENSKWLTEEAAQHIVVDNKYFENEDESRKNDDSFQTDLGNDSPFSNDVDVIDLTSPQIDLTKETHRFYSIDHQCNCSLDEDDINPKDRKRPKILDFEAQKNAAEIKSSPVTSPILLDEDAEESDTFSEPDHLEIQDNTDVSDKECEDEADSASSLIFRLQIEAEMEIENELRSTQLENTKDISSSTRSKSIRVKKTKEKGNAERKIKIKKQNVEKRNAISLKAPTEKIKFPSLAYLMEAQKRTEDMERNKDVAPLKIGEYTIYLVVDSREKRYDEETTAFQDELRLNGVRTLRRAINIGDFLWIARNEDGSDWDEETELVLSCIVERKTVNDLLNSIVDTRFDEQKHRLSNCGCDTVIYLVEGEVKSSAASSSESISSSQTQPMRMPWLPFGQKRFGHHLSHRGFYSPKTVNDALRNLQVVNRFIVHTTLHNDDSVKYLAELTKTLARSVEDGGAYSPASLRRKQTADGHSLFTFAQFQRMNKKKSAQTVSDVWKRMLAHFPGVSSYAAEDIASLYKTPLSLSRAVVECPPEKDILDVFTSIKLSNGRSIGQKVGNRLVQFFRSHEVADESEDNESENHNEDSAEMMKVTSDEENEENEENEEDEDEDEVLMLS